MLSFPVMSRWGAPSRVRWVRGCGAVLLGTLWMMSMGGCHAKPAETPVAEQSDPNEVTVTPGIAENLKVGEAEMHGISGELEVPARVETDVRRVARVGSPVSGRILRLQAFEGQTVRAGSVLALLHSNDLSTAQLALVKAHSQQALHAAATGRAEQLVAADVIGRAELERRRAEQLQADAEAASYRTELRGLGMGETQIRQLESTSKLNAEYPMIAPRSGMVLERKVAIGQVLQPADLAFTIADLSTVWITADVPEQEAGALHQGMAVTVHVPALHAAQLTGRLSFVAPIVDPATRTVQVRMDMDNSMGQLKPDELATMTFTGEPEQKLTIPSTAVVREDNKDYIFAQTGPGRFRLREVTLGVEEDDRRVVQSGVRPGERIVLDGAFHLNNQRKQNAIKGGA